MLVAVGKTVLRDPEDLRALSTVVSQSAVGMGKELWLSVPDP